LSSDFRFTFAGLERQYRAALDLGYEFLTCHDYVLRKHALPALTVVNRVDIDVSVRKAERLLAIFDRLRIKASFFVRLHAAEYNPFSFENYRILKAIRDSGHEIGYHSEVIDQSVIWHEDAAECFKRDIEVLNRMLGITVRGIASHGGMTALNNLDFWRDRSTADFGLEYEAYDKTDAFGLFDSSFYISDSEWTRWKCYDRGKLCDGDRRSFEEQARIKRPLLYLLIHPETYYDRHCYE
jgi:hypothetical protein